MSYNIIGKRVNAENGPEIVFSRTRELLTSAATLSTVPTSIQGYDSGKYEATKSVITAERINLNSISRNIALSTTSTKSRITSTSTKRTRSLTPPPHKIRSTPAPAPKVLTEEDKEKERSRLRTAALWLQKEQSEV